jgi:hypothetical protein
MDPLILSAFTMSTVSHGNAGLWRHPADRTSEYTSLSYWVDLAGGSTPAGSTCCSSSSSSATASASCTRGR